MKQTFQKITLVAFLILVSFLALFCTLLWTHALFGENGSWSLREGVIDKFISFIFYADMPLLLALALLALYHSLRGGISGYL